MIRVANLLSGDLDGITGALRDVLHSSLGRPVVAAAEAGLADFREGRVGIALICGLAYAWLHDARPGCFAAVAAPLIDDPRSVDEPVYFSEIVVPAASTARSLEDLSGARFVFNEKISFSGYRALEHALAARGRSWELFGERVRVGSHHASLERLAHGDADAAAIDSHVLILARRRDPGLAARLRVIESLGPYPAPPVAVNRDACDVPPETVMDRLGRLPAEALGAAAITGWRPMDDACYDAIRVVGGDCPCGSALRGI